MLMPALGVSRLHDLGGPNPIGRASSRYRPSLRAHQCPARGSGRSDRGSASAPLRRTVRRRSGASTPAADGFSVVGRAKKYWFSRANTIVQASTMSDPPFRFRLASFTRRSAWASHRAGAANATKREGPHAAGPGIAPQSVGLPTSRAPGPRRHWRSCCASADRHRCPGPTPRAPRLVVRERTGCVRRRTDAGFWIAR
jgi:hypothetical protein